ncbi:hypothetical protein BGP_0820 [Beggiatoa sp. PS]|nr:hypothetical protein BGP_0820 [Beggiatoa sp. PS]
MKIGQLPATGMTMIPSLITNNRLILVEILNLPTIGKLRPNFPKILMLLNSKNRVRDNLSQNAPNSTS